MPSSLCPVRRTTRRLSAALLAAATFALAPRPAAAQDVEMLSALSGRPLPAAYYERVRRDPHFFETRHEWKHRRVGERAADHGPEEAVRGNLRMVVMMGLFSDSPEPSVSPGTLQRQLFGDNPLGNLTQYYLEVSGGRLTITGSVIPWVRTSFTVRDAVANTWGLGGDGNFSWYLREVVERVDATVNFAQFDNDGPDNVPNSGDDDGRVDLAVFQIAETAASCGNDASVWPHRGALTAALGQPYATNEVTPAGKAIVVDDYHIDSVVDCDGTPRSIAAIAHETGHALGLPDLFDAAGILFDPGERRWVLGCWTLMAGGALGCGDGTVFGKAVSPPHMGPWEKRELGWTEPVVAEPGWRREYRLGPVQLTGATLQIPLVGRDEYLLLEYRTRTGFDRGLPAGGVLVYHVEIIRPFEFGCLTCFPVYHVQLVEADGDSALLKRPVDGGNRGVAGDVFAGLRTLNDFTRPPLWRHDRQRSNVSLEIDVADGFARILVSTPPVVATAPLVAPLMGGGGGGPTADERAALDLFGNRNGGYDMGDLRAYMRIRPGTVQGS
ncbi:MAG TPA: M6 family metalloprotease domain-containing protein [Longimicrobium sp.]|nr:M6 family metalloprotease domain-containing protein [Longimicrobium sp.]